MFTQLKGKNRTFKNFKIDARANIICILDEEYEIKRRICGKRKKYVQVQLLAFGTIRWYYLHRLMGYSWLGKPPHYLRRIIDHKDGDGTNNSIDNLRWVTSSANQLNKDVKNGIIFCEVTGLYYPSVLNFVHTKYGCPCKDTCKMMRKNLVECYIRYNSRFPECGTIYPHYSIHKY